MNKKTKIAFILNIVIVILTIFAFIVMFTDFKFMPGTETVIASSSVGRLRFFTIDSNLLMGIASLILLIEQKKLLEGKISSIDTKYYIFKLMATCSVGLTFIIVLVYLGWITPNGLLSMYVNKNLFFHGLIPLLSIIDFIFFEKTDRLKFKHTFLALIPIIIYAVYYLTNILLHIENNKVSPEYDWYYFLQNGIGKILIVLPIIFTLSYLISYILWYLNKRRYINEFK